MGQQAIVCSLQGDRTVLDQRREGAGPIATVDVDLAFVEGGPQLDPVAKILKANLGIVFKPLRERGVGKAALILQHLGHIPVIQIHKGRNATREQLIDHLVIELDTLGVHLAHTVRNDPHPGQAKTVGILTGLLHILDVFFVMVVEEAALVRHKVGIRHTTQFLTLFHGEVRSIGAGIFFMIGFHNGLGLAVTVPGTLRLEGRVSSTDQKVLGKTKTIHNKFSFCFYDDFII